MRVTFKSMFVVYTTQKNTLNLKVQNCIQKNSQSCDGEFF